MNCIKYNDFVNGMYDKKIDDLNFDKETIDFWLTRNFYLQMIDISGEVDRLASLDEKDIEPQLKRITGYLTIVRESRKNNFSNEVKKTLRIAEWELYDFYLWDNEFDNTSETVSGWFDQWLFNLNYDAVM